MMKEYTKRWKGEAVGEYLFGRAKDEGGFSLLELIVYIFILSIILSTAVLGFASMQNTSVLNNSSTQIKVAMEHGLNIAKNENQTVTMTFYGSASTHPNTYAYARSDIDTGKPMGTQEVPAKGVSYSTDSGVYYIKLLTGDSGVAIGSDVTVVFDPQGTVLTVTPASVVISCSGKSRTISVSANGEVSN